MNHRVRLPERIVLPRLSDVIDSGEDFLKARDADSWVASVVLDFKDAFKQLRVDVSEQR